MVMMLIAQVFPKMSSNHIIQKHIGVANIHIGVGSPGICKHFFPHWVEALAPEDINSLIHCRAVRHAPVLRPRSTLDVHLRQLQRHRGCMRAILLLHDNCNILAYYEPKEPIVDMRLRHTCHVKRRWMSPSAMSAAQSAAASRVTKPGPPGPRAPRSAMNATSATQNGRGCQIIPYLSRETKVHVTKRHACHAKYRGVTRS